MAEKTLGEYLRADLARNICDYTLRARIAADGRLTFYIHPQDVDGDTQDYEVNENTLAHDRDVQFVQPEVSP